MLDLSRRPVNQFTIVLLSSLTFQFIYSYILMELSASEVTPALEILKNQSRRGKCI